MTQKRVLIGMSGGVDSSVAAALLVEKGYEVVGVTLRLYDYARLNFEPPDGGCCSIELINDARSVCSSLGIPHYVIDMEKDFRQTVIEPFIESYISGKTPNPCIDCNRYIKWGEMIRTADKLGCDFIATGHYARIDRSEGHLRLLRALDLNKDQSYALWGIPREALSRTLLPNGDLTKTQVREKAREKGLVNAHRADSQDICFVPDGDYANLIKQDRGQGHPSLMPGPILDEQGKKLGEHKGYAHYTIGQRQGLGISSSRPLYVVSINPEKRSVTVGENEELFSDRFVVDSLNLLANVADIPHSVHVKIRYRHDGSAGQLRIIDKSSAEIVFDNPERAITAGQSAVFYSSDVVLGGGLIERVL